MNINVNLNAEAIWQTLDTKDGIKDGKIKKNIWDSFADITGGNHINNCIEERSAMKSINTYLRRASEETINKICEFLGWNNSKSDIKEEIKTADNLLEQISEDPSMITETEEGEYEDGATWKKAKLADGRWIRVNYTINGDVECIKVSSKVNEFEHYEDGLYDGAEVIYDEEGLYTGENNSDYTAFEVKIDDYDFSKYKKLAEKIFGANTKVNSNSSVGTFENDDIEFDDDNFYTAAHILMVGDNDYAAYKNNITGEVRYFDKNGNEISPDEFKETCPNIYNTMELRKSEKVVTKGNNGYYVTQDKNGNYYYYDSEHFDIDANSFKEVCPTIYENIQIKKSEKVVVKGDNGYYVTKDKNGKYHYYDQHKQEMSPNDFKYCCPQIYENLNKNKGV